MPRRVVPPELADRLRAAVELERLADSPDQLQRAVTATSRLMWAARRAGWRPTELAAAVGANLWTVARRTRVAAMAGKETGLVVPAPPAPSPAPDSPVDDRPLAEREWLRPSEACRLLGVAGATLAQWRTEGLTPGAQWRAGCYWYPREDLQRIAQAPRRQGGVDRDAVRSAIQHR